MLHVLGLLMKLVITLAIAILGFTWTPQGKAADAGESDVEHAKSLSILHF